MLLIGYSTEKTFAFFTDFARQQGAEFDVLDLSNIRSSAHFRLEDSAGDLIVSFGQCRFAFSEHRSFYLRSYWTDLGDAPRNACLWQAIAAIASYVQRCNGVVVNRPGAGMSNINKFTHTQLLRRYGFRTPETWIFGDADRALTVLDADGNWISKSCSSAKTRAAVLDESLYRRLDRLIVCPSLFQRRIRGADVRVHVVGRSLFAERIESDAIDYRFNKSATSPNRYSICEVPDGVASACRAYCRAEGLLFAGIDFKVSKDDGEWFVLEANQMPGYESYDRRQSHRISHALLGLLTGESTCGEGGTQ